MCGTEIPNAVQTTGNVGSVQLSSDFSIAGTGFQLNWLAVSGSNTIAPGTVEPGGMSFLSFSVLLILFCFARVVLYSFLTLTTLLSPCYQWG